MEIIDPRYLLADVAKILRRFDIAYSVTGGMAISVWAIPRFTADIDIVIQLNPQDIKGLAGALRELGKVVYIDEGSMRRALERHGEFNFIDGGTGAKVDFFVSKNGPFERGQFARRISKKISGAHVDFVSPEDLILSKLLWYNESESAKQLEDIRSVLRIQKKLNWKYLLLWAKKQSTLEILNSLRKRKK